MIVVNKMTGCIEIIDESPPLNVLNQWWYDNVDFVRSYCDKHHIECTDLNDTVEEATEELHLIDVQFWIDCVVRMTYQIPGMLPGRRRPKVVLQQNVSNWWLITLTSKAEWNEAEAKERIDRYRESHFKKYKYVWVEEHGTESDRYHQHIVAYNEKRFHTGINLQSTKYYDANINIKRVSNDDGSKERVIRYLGKENDPKGDIEFFRSRV